MPFREALDDPRLVQLSPERLSVARERMWQSYLAETPGAAEKYAAMDEAGRDAVRQKWNDGVAKYRPEVFNVTVVPEQRKTTLEDVDRANPYRFPRERFTPAVKRPLYDPKTEAFLKAVKDRTLDFASFDDKAVEELAPLVQASLTKDDAEPFFDHYRVRRMNEGLGPTKFADAAFVRGLNPSASLEKAGDKAGLAIASAVGLGEDEAKRQEDYRKWRVAWGELDESMRSAGAVAALASGGMTIQGAIRGLAMRAGPKVAAQLVAAGAMDYAYADQIPGFSAAAFESQTAKKVATGVEGFALAGGGEIIGSIMKMGNEAKAVIRAAVAPELVERAIKAVPDVAPKPYRPGAVQRAYDYLAAPISTVLEKVAPELKFKLREFELNLHQRTLRYKEMVKPLIQEVRRLPKDAQREFNLAALQGDSKKIETLVSTHKLSEQYGNYRRAMDLMRQDAQAAGFEVGYIPTFFSRKIKDVPAYMEKLYGSSGWGEIDRAIRDFQKKSGLAVVSDADKAKIADNVIRGYGSDKVTGAKPGILKERRIRTIPQELLSHYESWDKAALDYVDGVVNSTEKKRFFGAQMRAANPSPFFGDVVDNGVSQSIGALVSDLVGSGKLLAKDQALVAEILRARMVQKPASRFMSGVRNSVYLTTMTQLPSTAARQLQDIAVSAAKNGYFDTARSLVSRKTVKLKDLGFGDVGAEFGHGGTLSTAVDRLFTWTGVKYADRLTKETFINSAFRDARKVAKNSKHPRYGQLGRELAQMFGADAPKVLDDLANGRVNPNTKFYLFNKVADVQPIAMSEMPRAYLENPNGRVLYALKTFTLKQADLLRRDAFAEMRRGNVGRGVKNLVKLTAPIVLAGAGIDTALDIMYNRQPDIGPAVMDNMLRFIPGINRYITNEFRRTGDLRAAIGDAVLPPTGPISDAIKDVNKAAKGELEVGDARSWRNLPIAGQLYYWWLGGGAEKMAEKDTQVIETR